MVAMGTVGIKGTGGAYHGVEDHASSHNMHSLAAHAESEG